MSTDERWLAVPRYEGFYEVSDYGGVRSVRHMTRAGWRGGKVLRQSIDGDGYYRVSLSRHGQVVSRPVHQLVLEAFVRLSQPGEQGRHGPGGKLDNRVSNLCWGTAQDNSDDKIRDGTVAEGLRQGNARFTWDEVCEMRQRYADGESQSSIATAFATAQPVVSRIVRRESRVNS